MTVNRKHSTGRNPRRPEASQNMHTAPAARATVRAHVNNRKGGPAPDPGVPARSRLPHEGQQASRVGYEEGSTRTERPQTGQRPGRPSGVRDEIMSQHLA